MAEQLSDELLMERLTDEMERPAFNNWLGVKGVEITPEGEIHVLLPYRPEFGFDPSRSIFHGGIIASLIDIAGYAAVAIRSSAPTPTVTLTIDYLAPAIGDELLAKAQVRRSGRSLSRIDVDVYVGTRMVAMGRGVFSTKEPS